MTGWDSVAEWWMEEVTDPSYVEEVHPLLLDLLGDIDGRVVLEVGAGEGQVLRLLRSNGATALGMDASPTLARAAEWSFVGRLPDLSAVRSASIDAAAIVLVLEHLASLDGLFEGLARVVRPGGSLALIVNHPSITAPGAAPITDPTDGEVFLRPGAYLIEGFTDEPAGDGTVRFHHRPTGRILEAAAAAGWCLRRFVESGVSQRRLERDPSYAGQEHVLRVLGVAWVNGAGLTPPPGAPILA